MMLSKDLTILKLADFGMSKKMLLEERMQVRPSIPPFPTPSSLRMISPFQIRMPPYRRRSASEVY